MEKDMLTVDITNDFIVGDRITKETLNVYFRQHTGMTPQEYRRMKTPPSP